MGMENVRNVFSPDSVFMRTMSRVADLMLLNVVFLITSIPILTIGPSLAALYSVVFSFGTDRENGVIRKYFHTFRESFFSAFFVWLLLLGVGAALVLDVYLLNWLGGFASILNVVTGILIGVELLAACMVFPLLSIFQNSMLGTVRNALILGLAHLPRTVVVLVLWLFPVFALVRMPLTFFYAGFIWIAIYFSAAAYITSLLYKKVFAPYLSGEESA